MKTRAALPNGKVWFATPDAHRHVWSLWRRVCRVALVEGSGVEVSRRGRWVVIQTIYAPQYGGHLYEVSPEGSVWIGNEPNAALIPDATEADTACPWL